jgi:ABC-2 type transport system permease protein
MRVVFWKELADLFGSKRFIILFFLILIVAGAAVYLAGQSLQEDPPLDTSYVYLRLFTQGAGGLPSFLSFLSFFGPLLGILLGFDAVNSEFSRGTVSRVLAQPIYRDSWINGKFLAGLATLALALAGIMLIIFGLGLYALGFPPDGGELARMFTFFLLGLVYLGFWLALGIMFSILFRQAASSALAGIAVWLFFTLFFYMAAGLIADQLAPVALDSPPQEWARHEAIRDMVLRFSPVTLFEEATRAVLMPTYRGLGIVQALLQPNVPTNPLPLGQSLLIVWPQLVSLVALTAVCFGISYVLFMRREVRAI